MKLNSVVVCILVFMSLLIATSAVAGKKKRNAKDKQTAALKAESKDHFKTGLALVEGEDFAAAAIAFETAYEIYPTNGVLYNLSECYKALHQYKEQYEALMLLKSKLGNGRTDKKLAPLVDKRVNEIKGIVGFLTITVNEPGATISVNGQEMGVSPLEKPLILGPAKYTLAVSLDGFQTVNREIKVKPKSEVEETFELMPAAAEVVVSDTEGESSFDTMPTESASPLKPLFWGGVVGTGLTAIAGGVFWGLTVKQAGVVDDKYKELETSGAANTDSIDTLEDKRVTFKNTAMGLSIAAGAFAVGTAVLFVLDKRISYEGERGAIDVSVLPGSLVVSF